MRLRLTVIRDSYGGAFRRKCEHIPRPPYSRHLFYFSPFEWYRVSVLIEIECTFSCRKLLSSLCPTLGAKSDLINNAGIILIAPDGQRADWKQCRFRAYRLVVIPSENPWRNDIERNVLKLNMLNEFLSNETFVCCVSFFARFWRIIYSLGQNY